MSPLRILKAGLRELKRLPWGDMIILFGLVAVALIVIGVVVHWGISLA